MAPHTLTRLGVEEGVVESGSTGSRVLPLTDLHVEMRPDEDNHFMRAKGGERVY